MLTRKIAVKVGETVERDGFALRICCRLNFSSSPRSGDPARFPLAREWAGGLTPQHPAGALAHLGDDLLAASASISSSVMVLSRGCMVTAMAIDFLPGSMPLPS